MVKLLIELEYSRCTGAVGRGSLETPFLFPSLALPLCSIACCLTLDCISCVLHITCCRCGAGSYVSCHQVELSLLGTGGL